MEAMLLYAVFWILPAVLAGLLAQAKGYDFILFFFTGLIFSVLAAVFIATVLPDRFEAVADGPAAQTASRPQRSLIPVIAAAVVFAAIVATVAVVAN